MNWLVMLNLSALVYNTVLFGKVLFDLISDRLYQVCLSQPHPSVDNEWVEGGASGFWGHGSRHCDTSGRSSRPLSESKL